jgi:hypothetical protein
VFFGRLIGDLEEVRNRSIDVWCIDEWVIEFWLWEVAAFQRTEKGVVSRIKIAWWQYLVQIQFFLCFLFSLSVLSDDGHRNSVVCFIVDCFGHLIARSALQFQYNSPLAKSHWLAKPVENGGWDGIVQRRVKGSHLKLILTLPAKSRLSSPPSWFLAASGLSESRKDCGEVVEHVRVYHFLARNQLPRHTRFPQYR